MLQEWCYIIGISILFVSLSSCIRIDSVKCGIDYEVAVMIGQVPIQKYPWIGILYYDGDILAGEARAVTTVALIHREFVIANAADFVLMPKRDFRHKLRVLLGERWPEVGRRIKNYVIHAEYEQTHNTIALIQLMDYVTDEKIKPPCFGSERMVNLVFYVIKFKEDYTDLRKEVLSATHIPADLCNQYYMKTKTPIFSVFEANMYMNRSPHVACAVCLQEAGLCEWDAGAALAVRDVWGRWQLLGVGVRGPGCGAPARFLDISSYAPWILASLDRFQSVTISAINKHKYILKGGTGLGLDHQRFGDCEPEEKTNCISIEQITLKADHNMLRQNYTYNLTIYANIEYTCLTLELVNASAVSEIRIQRVCPNAKYGEPCHFYRGPALSLPVNIVFSDECLFEIYAWGYYKSMKLLDIQEWKWEEGTYYDDFYTAHEEYRSQAYITEYRYEPLDRNMWLPEWTTRNDMYVTTTTKPRKSKTNTNTRHKNKYRRRNGKLGKSFQKSKKKGRECPLCDLLLGH